MPDLAVLGNFATALLLGALIGVEREKRNMREGNGTAGLRSFVLLAMIGAVTGHLATTLAQPWLLPAALLAVALFVASGYFAAARQRPTSLGLTTELAALVTCLLGALATTGQRELAIALGVTTTALLAYKGLLHGLVERLGNDDVLAGLRFLLAMFVVLPILPDRAVDPWGAINPYKLWLLVLLISGLSLVGYVATRWLGPGRGIAVTAASGGLVSSTAVTLAMVKQSREEGAQPRRLAGGILLAWTVMFVRIVVVATIVCPALLSSLVVPFGAMGLACGAVAVACLAGGGQGAANEGDVPIKNPFSLLSAAKFALVFAVVQLLLQLGQRYLPESGALVVAAISGLTDVDAIVLSMAERARLDDSSVLFAVTAIAIAAASNTLVKTGMAVFLGRGLGRPVLAGTGLILVAGAAALWLR